MGELSKITGNTNEVLNKTDVSADNTVPKEFKQALESLQEENVIVAQLKITAELLWYVLCTSPTHIIDTVEGYKRKILLLIRQGDSASWDLN